MLFAIRRSLSLPPHRVSVRRNVVKLDRKYHAKVSALPFVLTKDEAVRHVAPWASFASMGKGLVGSVLAKYFPEFKSEPLQPDDFMAVYIPVWFVDGEVMGNITKLGTEVPAMVHSLNSYMPGFSFDPLSALSFSQPRLEELAVPFTPKLQHQHGLDVSCLPFSISPVPLPKVVKSLIPSQSKLPDSVTFDAKSVEFSMLAAYPVLLPIYLMRYDLQVLTLPGTISFTCMVQAHSGDALTYIDSAAQEIGDLLREAAHLTPGSLLHRFSHLMDDVPTWEIHGTSYGFSSIGIPITRPVIDSFNEAISAWMDQRILSKSDMSALAEYGVDMDHPCVRVYTKEEVDANRKFLVGSAECFRMQKYLEKASVENINSGKVKIQVSGKNFGGPDAVLEFLKKRMVDVEKQRDELKPQWLREWEDSRRPGQSAPP